MMNLSAAPNRAMRMNELAAPSLLSLSGMTRVVTRLDNAALVRRFRCGDDARGWTAVLTDSALDRLNRSWPRHLAGVRRHVLDHLDNADLAHLTAILKRIAV
jgi:DNA-binding MarR family transcriptional regulator